MFIYMFLVLFVFICTNAKLCLLGVYAYDGGTGATSIVHQQQRRTQTDVLTDGSLFRQANFTGTPTNAPVVPLPTTNSPTGLPVIPSPTTSSPTAVPIVLTPTTSLPTAAPVIPTPTTTSPTAAPVPPTPTTSTPTLIPGTTAAPIVNTTIPTNATTTPISPTSTNATAPVPSKGVNATAPSKMPTRTPLKYCDEFDRRRLSMNSKMKTSKGKGKGTKKEAKKVVKKDANKETRKNYYYDEDEDVYYPCLEHEAITKGMGKKNTKMGMTKNNKGKGKGKGKGGIPDELFRGKFDTTYLTANLV
jgi:hypothetical protein